MGDRPKKWIVTGGAGFLGTNFLHATDASFGDVVVVGRGEPRWPVMRPWIRYARHDIRDVNAFAHELVPDSVVVHLASGSYPGKTDRILEKEIQENVIGTLRLADVCAQRRIRSFVSISSGGTIYGDQGMGVRLHEESPIHPVSAYGAMKLSIEHYLSVLHHLHGLPVAFMRVGNAFGPWHRSAQGAPNVFLRKLLHDEPIEIWGEGNQVRDYIYSADVARALVAVGSSFQSGVEAFNIGTGVGLSLREIISACETVTGKKGHVSYQPARGVDVQSNVLDARKFQERFFWTPTVRLEEGLRRTWEWTRTADDVLDQVSES